MIVSGRSGKFSTTMGDPSEGTPLGQREVLLSLSRNEKFRLPSPVLTMRATFSLVNMPSAEIRGQLLHENNVESIAVRKQTTNVLV